MMQYFKGIVLFMLFYSFAVTTYCYFIPADALNYTSVFSSNTVNFEETAAQFEDSLSSQTSLPLVDLGALVFYSGNYLIDLMLNFAFAIPNMITTLLSSIAMLFGVNTYVWAYLDLVAKTAMIIFYFIGIIQLILTMRAGQSIV